MHQRALAAAIAIGIANTCQGADNTVYRCEQDGKITYTDDPCLNAKEVDVTPTEGMNKWSGKVRKDPALTIKQIGETQTKAMHEATRQLTGVTDDEWKQALRDNRRPIEIRRECRQLDQQLPGLKETAAQTSKGPQKEKAELSLYKARKRFKSLKC